MLTRSGILRPLAFGVALLFTRIAGNTQPWGPLTNEHPIVIDHLIHLYDGLTSQIAARNSADPEHADSRQQGAMGLFGVSAAGYQTMGIILSAAKVKLDTERSAQSKYVSGLASNTPSTSVQATMQDFHQQQLATFRQVLVDLKAQLNSTDWAALQAFIGTELTGKIKVGMMNRPVNPPPGNAKP